MGILNELKPEYVTNKKGEKKSVILSIEEFEELIEDIEDLEAMAERSEEPSIPHEKLVEQLKQDGFL